MMMNLFSMFDMSSYYLNPTLVLMVILMATFNSKKISFLESNLSTAVNSFTALLVGELKEDLEKLKLNSKMKMSTVVKNTGTKKMFILMFLGVFLMNYMSLYPMVFSLTSHISMSFTVAATMWLSSLIQGIKISKLGFMSHFTPVGTPIVLMSFMVCIETVSTIIRPLTLAVRLTANLVAGHLLLFLLSKMVLFLGALWFTTFPFMMVLSILETMVSLIQGYVITLLLILYFKESF